MSNVLRYDNDESTEKTRKIVFAVMAIGLAFVPFVVYSAFFQSKTEIIYVGQATQQQLDSEIEKNKRILSGLNGLNGSAAITEEQMFCMNKNNDDLSKCLK